MNKAEFRFRSKLCIDSAPVTKSDHMQQLTECIHWKLKFTRADVACNWLTPAAECRVELLGLHIHPGRCDVVATFNTLIRPTVVNNGASVLCIRLTVVASEQLFSSAGQLFTDRRNGPRGYNAEKLLFMAFNIRLFGFRYWPYCLDLALDCWTKMAVWRTSVMCEIVTVILQCHYVSDHFINCHSVTRLFGFGSVSAETEYSISVSV